jgi:arylsulfatase
VLPLSLVACSLAAAGSAEPPNVLLIVADDLGYADLGAYGSDIATPNIDALAGEGVLFTRFHTAPMCAPTRAMLLSGNNNHVAGMANQQREGILGRPYPGYENGLSSRVAPLPRLLRDAGYNTYSVGKWHLGLTPEHSPTAAGFTRSWNMLDGAGTHYDGVGFENRPSTFWHDGDYTRYPDGEYATQWYTDRLMEFIDAGRGDGKPFFAYAAYTAPHWPLQVPEAERDRYAGRYDDGYDALRLRRFESLVDAGIVAAGTPMPHRNPAITPWEDLDERQKQREARRMELYAAMVANLDGHIGRLLAYLRDIGELDSTLIVFMSDNGAAGEDFFNTGPFVAYLRARFDNSYENMGTPKSFVAYGPPWAEASSAPFSRHKTYTRQGGIVAPMIIAGPGVVQQGAVEHDFVTVMDLAPTILDLAGISYPDDEALAAPEGETLLPLLRGERTAAHEHDRTMALYHRGRAFLRHGPWKLVTLEPPFDESKFELYNVVRDPGETADLAAEEPEKYRELIGLWRSERRRLGIVLPQDL